MATADKKNHGLLQHGKNTISKLCGKLDVTGICLCFMVDDASLSTLQSQKNYTPYRRADKGRHPPLAQTIMHLIYPLLINKTTDSFSMVKALYLNCTAS